MVLPDRIRVLDVALVNLLSICCLLAIIVSVNGCQSKSQSIDAEARARMQQLASLYSRYLSEHRGKAPRNEAVFREFVLRVCPPPGDDPATEFDRLLVSARDEQPLTIYYSGDIEAQTQGVVAVEKVGSDDGKLQVDQLGLVSLHQ